MLDGHVLLAERLLMLKRLVLSQRSSWLKNKRLQKICLWAKEPKANYARPRREALAILAADAANCYDIMVNHLILALLLQAIGVPFSANICMLFIRL
jgi:hypothetical protein